MPIICGKLSKLFVNDLLKHINSGKLNEIDILIEIWLYLKFVFLLIVSIFDCYDRKRNICIPLLNKLRHIQFIDNNKNELVVGVI